MPYGVDNFYSDVGLGAFALPADMIEVGLGAFALPADMIDEFPSDISPLSTSTTFDVNNIPNDNALKA
jgi:hypothetical protein